MAEPDIFLSYNREDAEVARRFAEGFEAQGFDVWWDQALRSGEAYDEVTEAALRNAKAVVVLWSPRSVVSRWVRAEATLADRNRTLVPARIEPCDLPIMFELTQTADLSHWQGETGDTGWQEFTGDVRRCVDAGARKRHSELQPEPKPPAKRPPRFGRPSIAILPFINRSELREDEVFANGMVDDLIVALSTARQVKLVAASATAIYRKEARDLHQIGRELGVRYLLEGNVRRIEDTLRVTAQLVEAETDNIIWTQKFDRPLAELAILQEDLAAEVAGHLGVQVQRAEVENALKKPNNISAWEALLRSDGYVFRGTRAGYEAAVAEAKRALEIDPDYGPAYAVLAAAQSQLLRELGGEAPELVVEVAENVRRACAFEPQSPLVLCRIATALMVLGKLDDALAMIERAVASNPNIDIVRNTRGAILTKLGRYNEALAELDAAEKLGPGGPWIGHIWSSRSITYLLAGRPDLALEAAERAAVHTTSPAVQLYQAICLEVLDRPERARDIIRRLRDLDGELTMSSATGMLRILAGSSLAMEEYLDVLRRPWEATEGDG